MGSTIPPRLGNQGQEIQMNFKNKAGKTITVKIIEGERVWSERESRQVWKNQRVEMTGPTGTHSVNLFDHFTDENLKVEMGRAIVHLIGFMQTNECDVREIARAVTHVSQDTVDNFGPSMPFCHAEFRRGVLAGWQIRNRSRKGSETYEYAGYTLARRLRSYISLPLRPVARPVAEARADSPIQFTTRDHSERR